MRSIPHSIAPYSILESSEPWKVTRLWRIEMTIKSRRTFLAFAMFAISSVALAPGQAAVAKSTIRPDARNHQIHWTPGLRTPVSQSKRPTDNPFASMLLG
jgi:hypothetical protein